MSAFIRVWASRRALIVYLVLIALVPLIFPNELREIPFAPNGWANPLHLVSLGAAALLVPQVSAPNSLSEAMYPSVPQRRLYALWAALLFSSSVAVLWFVGLAAHVQPFDLLLLTRNFTLGLGVLLISQRFLSPSLSWLPLLLYTACTWLFGTQDDALSTPYGWALPLQQLSSYGTDLICLAIFGIGILCFLSPRERSVALLRR